ncbi:hypothetical protein SOVF_130090, partial [Spinacia oleracea]
MLKCKICFICLNCLIPLLLAPMFIYCRKKANLMVGNVLPLRSIPEGDVVCNVEHHVGDRDPDNDTS